MAMFKGTQRGGRMTKRELPEQMSALLEKLIP